jgi:hypothetical protein
VGEKNVWCHKYWNLIRTLDIPLRKIVLLNYRGNKSHVNFAKFFILNARLLESMVFVPDCEEPSIEWIEKQHKLLQTKNKASRFAQFGFELAQNVNKGSRFDFRYHASWYGHFHHMHNGMAHDLSTTDPFVRFGEWANC